MWPGVPVCRPPWQPPFMGGVADPLAAASPSCLAAAPRIPLAARPASAAGDRPRVWGAAAPPGSAPRLQPLLAQAAHDLDVVELDLLAGEAGSLEQRREPVERGLGQERGAALLADLAVAERGVAVAVGA